MAPRLGYLMPMPRTTSARRLLPSVTTQIALLLSTWALPAGAQPVEELIRAHVEQLRATGDLELDGVTIAARNLLPRIYEAREFAPTWSEPCTDRLAARDDRRELPRGPRPARLPRRPGARGARGIRERRCANRRRTRRARRDADRQRNSPRLSPALRQGRPDRVEPELELEAGPDGPRSRGHDSARDRRAVDARVRRRGDPACFPVSAVQGRARAIP